MLRADAHRLDLFTSPEDLPATWLRFFDGFAPLSYTAARQVRLRFGVVLRLARSHTAQVFVRLNVMMVCDERGGQTVEYYDTENLQSTESADDTHTDAASEATQTNGSTAEQSSTEHSTLKSTTTHDAAASQPVDQAEATPAQAAAEPAEPAAKKADKTDAQDEASDNKKADKKAEAKEDPETEAERLMSYSTMALKWPEGWREMLKQSASSAVATPPAEGFHRTVHVVTFETGFTLTQKPTPAGQFFSFLNELRVKPMRGWTIVDIDHTFSDDAVSEFDRVSQALLHSKDLPVGAATSFNKDP